MVSHKTCLKDKVMEQANENAPYSFGEELANSITHGAGILLSVAALVLLMIFSNQHGTARHIVSCAIFGATLILLYSASTLYHSLKNPNIKRIFKIFDHASIYLLIAGTYTPFLIVVLNGVTGWILFIIIWLLAITGVVLKIFFIHRFKILSTIAYVFMGWIIVFAIKPLMESLPAGGLFWLVAGGLIYTLGVIFYLWKKLPFNHAVWHLFVLGGSSCHFFTVMFYILPKAA